MASAADIDVALEALADRTACLVPDKRSFTVDGSWAKPALAVFIDFVVVGQGAPGGIGTAGAAGGGGSSGEIRRMVIPASEVPDSLTVLIGAGLTQVFFGTTFAINAHVGGAGADGTTTGGNGGTWAQPTQAGAGGSSGAGADATAFSASAAAGGGGGDSSFAGGAGADGLGGGKGGAGGLTGASTSGGGAGLGYGAGGGGAASTGAAPYAGGGGGGGGYGKRALAQQGPSNIDPNVAAAGAPGYVMITTWCGVNLRP